MKKKTKTKIKQKMSLFQASNGIARSTRFNNPQFETRWKKKKPYRQGLTQTNRNLMRYTIIRNSNFNRMMVNRTQSHASTNKKSLNYKKKQPYLLGEGRRNKYQFSLYKQPQKNSHKKLTSNAYTVLNNHPHHHQTHRKKQ